ncbi:cysteine-rich DPF motif domain-containing protein 1 isoform X2 [Odocoileus virginianus]|uniref:Cysteine-rich DPF motif domain-containing protein 1 n=1 Tax=Odocoileus virginianus TaxID=9874 RepID=A0ABM4H209_ODOVR
MACETERNPLGVFKCQLCALTAPYSYKGQQPPDSQSVILLEESYVMRDPFTPDKGRFLIVGSRCSVCSKLVCVDPVGMQFILLQEILPPLCPGQHGCFPSGNPARLGEKESPLHEACQPAQFSTMSAVGYQVHLGLVPTRASMAQDRDGAEMEPLCRPSSWATGSRVCSRTRVRNWQRRCPQPDPRCQRSGTAAAHPHSPQLSSW